MFVTYILKILTVPSWEKIREMYFSYFFIELAVTKSSKTLFFNKTFFLTKDDV